MTSDRGDLPKPPKDSLTQSFQDRVAQKRAENERRHGPRPVQNQPQLAEHVGVPSDESVEIPRPTDERYGWPKDWKERFKQEKIMQRDPIIRDPDSLLGVDHFHKGTERGYFAFDQTRERFSRRNDLYIGESDQGGQQTRVSLSGDGHADWRATRSTLTITNKEGQETAIVDKRVGGRDLLVYYSNGQFSSLRLDSMPHSRFLQSDDEESRSNMYLYQGELVDSQSGDLQGEIDENAGIAHINRLEDDKIVDSFSIPITVDFAQIKGELFPEELLKNPTNPNPDLDEGWRGVDPVDRVGITWELKEDDRLHSLTPIPEPAPEDA